MLGVPHPPDTSNLCWTVQSSLSFQSLSDTVRISHPSEFSFHRVFAANAFIGVYNWNGQTGTVGAFQSRVLFHHLINTSCVGIATSYFIYA